MLSYCFLRQKHPIDVTLWMKWGNILGIFRLHKYYDDARGEMDLSVKLLCRLQLLSNSGYFFFDIDSCAWCCTYEVLLKPIWKFCSIYVFVSSQHKCTQFNFVCTIAKNLFNCKSVSNKLRGLWDCSLQYYYVVISIGRHFYVFTILDKADSCQGNTQEFF